MTTVKMVVMPLRWTGRKASMCFIGGKYKPIILWHLNDGENALVKFND